MVLMVAITLVFLIGVVVVVTLNQTASYHQLSSAQNVKSQGGAEEGLNYAIQELSQSLLTWQAALSGTFPSDFNTGTALASPNGNAFRIWASVGTSQNPDLQPYQVAVTTEGMAKKQGIEVATRAIQAYVSQRTLGADLTTGLHAAAALELAAQLGVNAGFGPSTLAVHWGPIVCLDLNGNLAGAWPLPNPADGSQFPRKFSTGGITGASFARSGTVSFSNFSTTPPSGTFTDGKEYWAYAPLVMPPLIDEAAYIWLAEHETAILPPISASTHLAMQATNCLPATNTTCGYFVPAPGDAALFDGASPGYAASSAVTIYVNGSAIFNKTAINGASFLITGGLTVNDATGGTALTLHVPVYAATEYPYHPALQPCAGATSCAPEPNIPFRGFLDVKGYMNVTVPGWTMAGALLVGDPQAVAGTAATLVPSYGLTLYYDDFINHAILVQPLLGTTAIRIEPDLIKNVPTR